jgi:hypothetical protein
MRKTRLIRAPSDDRAVAIARDNIECGLSAAYSDVGMLINSPANVDNNGKDQTSATVLSQK